MLEEAPPASFRELICEVFDEIEGFRKNGRSWNEIHAHISAQIPIGIRTLQMYYRDESIRRTAKE